MTASAPAHIIVTGEAATAAFAATALARSLQGSRCRVTLLVNRDDAAALPVVQCRGGPGSPHALLGIDEPGLIERTAAGIGLGTRYAGIFGDGEAFVPLGRGGPVRRLVDFHQHVARLRAQGHAADLNAYSRQSALARQGDEAGIRENLRKLDEYELFMDRGAYASFIQTDAERFGAQVLHAAVRGVQRGADGPIDALVLGDGGTVNGDFFVDASEDGTIICALDSTRRFRDWSRYLPCDLVAHVIEQPGEPHAYASVSAHELGWVRRVCARDSTMLVAARSSVDAGDDDLRKMPGTGQSGARIRESSGTIRPEGSFARHWIANCVAVGPAAFSLAPLEVSGFELAQSATMMLLGMLPASRQSPALAEEYNRRMTAILESVRDYHALRYALASAAAGPFWQRTRDLALPDSLRDRIELFRSRGRFTARDGEFPSSHNWIYSMVNLGGWPEAYDPLADLVDERRVAADFARLIQRA